MDYKTRPMDSNKNCGICKVLVSNSYITCSICKSLTHLICANIPVNSFKTNSNNFKNYFCRNCSLNFPFNNLTDPELKHFNTIPNNFDNSHIISEILDKCRTIESDTLQEVLTSNNDFLTNPEAQFFTKLTNCHYYLSNQLDTNLEHVTGLSLIHFNARSLQASCENIEQFINLLNRSFDIIAFSETWRTDSTNLGNFLTDYIPSHTNRLVGRGGGVSIYVKKTISFKVVQTSLTA